MTLTTKVGSGALIASSLAGLGAAGGRQLRQEEPSTTQQKTKIINLITNRYDYIILDDTDASNQYWGENWNAYRTAGDNIFQLTGWKAGDSSLDLTTELKSKCATLANKSILENDNTSYDNFAKYCTRGVTIKEKVAKLGLRIVSVTASGNDPDWSIWDKRSRGALNKELKALKVNTNFLGNAYKIRDACRDIITTNKKEDGYEDILKAYERVCAKQKGEP
ncbi:hypothetical protein A6V39_01325 [Candidatus Mycoplasma haematobovis]|uniref:Uncharacterized protein n=1 Tax=Candidatus Mycoplasma haematobovis TaxID=432608 RepID=A0A1A9QFE8_9MOLU|nr:hypothetical protein [Candidatus Mycoplasma haematobovis]OAL10695.1 hypothetical protein A6V39_01325 [Candidatus Mycoplasma haematobovis]